MKIDTAFNRRSTWQLVWTLCAVTACSGRLLVDDSTPGARGGAGGAAASGVGSGGVSGANAAGANTSGVGGNGTSDAADIRGSGGTQVAVVADAATDARGAGSAASSGGVSGAGAADAGNRDAGRATGGAPNADASCTMNCVECNHDADCAPGKYCGADHTCGTAACTDTNCGGACAPCELGKRCLANPDCASYACDAATGLCIQDACVDHRQDGNETDTDCGGGICGGCNLGQKCILDADCKSVACDTATLKCVSDQCADHRQDGAETDVDCGGADCNNCDVGKRCHNNGDCASGHICYSGPQSTCH